MSKNSIKQLAFARYNNSCPVCEKPIRRRKFFNIELHNYETRIFADGCCELLYCDYCDLPLIDGKIISHIEKETGMRPCTLPAEKKTKKKGPNELSNIKKKMYQRKDNAVSQEYFNKCYRITHKKSCWKPCKKLYSLNDKESCPYCNQPLLNDTRDIPIGENTYLSVDGLICRKCSGMFIKDADEISEKLKDNPYANGFYINGIAYWQYSKIEKRRKDKDKERSERQRKKHILDSIESSVVLITVLFLDKTTSEYVITAAKPNDTAENIICYSSAIGRELLTATCIPSRRKQGKINDKKYRVISEFQQKNMQEKLIPSDVEIRHDGGYSSSVKNRNFEIIDLLLYSPYNDVYECVHATHDKKDDVCYMDISIYKSFIKNSGNPSINLRFGDSTSGDYYELNEESILKCYGYSVAKKENLSSAKRRELLAELVDLKILPVAKIVHHLEFCIKSHTGSKYTEARYKWMSDKEFIKNYNVNPGRFMLSKRYILK